MKWLFVSACHGGMLADNPTPVGSGRFRNHAQDSRGVLGMSFSSSLALREEGWWHTLTGTRLGRKSHFLLNKAATGNKLEKHPADKRNLFPAPHSLQFLPFEERMSLGVITG